MTDFHVAYRPDEFQYVLGQDHVVDSLREIERKNNWPHAYLLVGPSGTGKTTVARIIANKLGCEPQNLVEIDAASRSSVDGVRELTKNMGYKGFGKSSTRVFIIDECHSLSKQAWQALLKSIEEPPAHVYFILCTTEVAKVPATIKTRCTVYNFRSVNVDDLTDLVEYVAQTEELDNLTEKMLVKIAQRSEGSPRQALTILSKCQGVDSMEDLDMVLESAEDNKSIIDLCRMLAGQNGGITWKKCVTLIQKLEELPPETIRLTIVNYMAKVLENTTEEGRAIRVLTILDAFKNPWNPSEKKAPLLLAIGSIVFEVEDE